MRSVLVLMIVLTPLMAGSTVVREIYGPSFGGQRVPALDKGYLLALQQSSPVLDVYDLPVSTLVVAMAPNQDAAISLSDAAIDTDGIIVATAGYTGTTVMQGPWSSSMRPANSRASSTQADTCL